MLFEKHLPYWTKLFVKFRHFCPVKQPEDASFLEQNFFRTIFGRAKFSSPSKNFVTIVRQSFIR